MPPVLSTSHVHSPILRGLSAPLAGLWFIAQRRRLWAAAAWFALLALPVTLVTPTLIAAFNFYGWRLGTATIDGHRAAWLLHSMVACVLMVGSTALTHLVWTAWFGVCLRRAALNLARQTENCLGISKEEFCNTGERDLLKEVRIDLRHLPIAWGILTLAAALPIVGQILCVAVTLVLASTLMAHLLFHLPRCLRNESPGRDFPFIDRNFLTAAPLGFSVLLSCLVPLLGALWFAGSVVAGVRLFRWLDNSGGMLTPSFPRAPLAIAELERFDG